MKVVESKADLRAALDAERSRGAIAGFVPTMGYLHDGHVSLMNLARAQCSTVAVSIFVNPLQFGPSEDLGSYPRSLDEDLERCAAAGADYVFVPTVKEMYSDPNPIRVVCGELGEKLCGRSRPGHFDGVATVVAKLFGIFGSGRAYFGQKDAQQLVVIRQLVKALDFPIQIVGCPTVRESDGLAMSSRNSYLNAEERGAAAVLSKALDEAASNIESGERDGRRIAALMGMRISSEPLANLDYASCVDPQSLDDVQQIEGPVLLAIAAGIGRARLIDNTTVTPDAGASIGG